MERTRKEQEELEAQLAFEQIAKVKHPEPKIYDETDRIMAHKDGYEQGLGDRRIQDRELKDLNEKLVRSEKELTTIKANLSKILEIKGVQLAIAMSENLDKTSEYLENLKTKALKELFKQTGGER